MNVDSTFNSIQLAVTTVALGGTGLMHVFFWSAGGVEELVNVGSNVGSELTSTLALCW